jgi:hypothetical protein
MNDPSLCHLRHQVRRITDAGFSLVLVCHPDRVEAVASPDRAVTSRGGSGRSSVVRYLDGGGPDAVAAAVSELADAVGLIRARNREGKAPAEPDLIERGF